MRAANGQRDPLEKPWNRHALIRMLAEGKITQAEMATRMGVTPPSVTAFKQRHADAIAAVRADIENEFAGIQIAQKSNRLAAYEELLDRAAGGKDRHLEARVLRQIAEEMGHLPSRMQLSGTVGIQTTYTVTGEDGSPIDTEALK
jgi:hypothetical protein